MTLPLFLALVYLVGGALLFLLGVVLLREDPGARVNRSTALMLFFGGLGPILAAAGLLIDTYKPPSTFLYTDLVRNFAYLWEFFFPALVVFSLVYPREKKAVRERRFLTLWIYLPHLAHLALLAVVPNPDRLAKLVGATAGKTGVVSEIFGTFLQASGVLFELLYRFHVRFFWFVNLAYVIAALAFLGQSWRRTRHPRLKRQVGLTLLGIGGAAALYAVFGPLADLVGWTPPGEMRNVVVAVSLTLASGTIAVIVVRDRFLEVRLVARRGVLYATISAVLFGLYWLGVRQVDRLSTQILGQSTFVFEAFFLILAVILFQPMANRMEEWMEERVFRRGRAGPRRALVDLTRDLQSSLDPTDLERGLREALHQSLLVDKAGILLWDPSERSFCSPDGDHTIRPHEDDPLHSVLQAGAAPITIKDLSLASPRGEPRDRAREAWRGIGADLLVPLHAAPAGGEPALLGLLHVGPKATASRFTNEDLALLSAVGNQVANRLENTRLYREALEKRVLEEELATAREIQRTLLPKRLPEIPGVEVAAVNVSSRHVGGDYYDFLPMGNGALCVAIGDVSGKGVPAALLMSTLHAGLRAQVLRGDAAPADLGAIVARMNRIVFEATSIENFATFFVAVLDFAARRLRFTNAGHNLPILIHADGSLETPREGDLILGVMPDVAYEEAERRITPGDTLVLWTDGVTETAAPDGEQYGEARLEALLRSLANRPADEVLDAVRASVQEHARSPAFDDDFTLAVVRVVP